MKEQESIKCIRDKAVELLINKSTGMRIKDLKNEILKETKDKFNDITLSKIDNSIWNLHIKREAIFKLDGGILIHKDHYKDTIIDVPEALSKEKKSEEMKSEEQLYGPFADFLMQIENVKAYPLGSSHNKQKWGTPDVVGIHSASKGEIYQYSMEIITAEIKIKNNPHSLITAFGQASAYRSFSHKVYLVIPNNDKDKESKRAISRIESLCIVTGIGLVVFPSEKQTIGNVQGLTNTNREIDFRIRVRATKFEPDHLLCNEFLKILIKVEGFKDIFNELY